MSLSCFVPANTQKARTTGISAFERMLKEENVSMDVIQACILRDKTGKTLAAVMDRFGYHLATYEGKKGKLASNTAISYYRNVKLWFFDTFPLLRVPTELVLLKQGKTLEKHCLKRENGGFTNKAPPCSKDDLRSLVRYVYSTAAVPSDYEDAALACLMWYCFGRSSDLGYVSKQHITMSADSVFFVRMLRVKTAEEQGLTLVPDRDDFLTCPLHTLAVTLVMQEAPCASPREDRKVARVLSGWKPNETPSIADISVLDHGAQECLARMQELLFGSCMGLENTKLNVSRKVIGVLTAYLIKYLPQMKTLAPESLYIVRIMECLDAASISLAEMLAWSSALTAITAGPERDHKLHDSKPNSCKSECHHAALINELIESNRLMTARLLALEAAVLQQTTGHKATTQPTQTEDLSEQQPKPKRRKKAATNLSSMWFEWYTRLPRVWDSSDRQKKSDYRLVVAYMKLFLDGGFQLCEDAPDYKDRVLAVGQQAESAVLAFLKSHNIRAKGGSSVLREMRKLHRSGELDPRIVSYRSRLAVEQIIDPAPVVSQDILQVVGNAVVK